MGDSIALLDNAQALLDRLNTVAKADNHLIIEQKKLTVKGQETTLQDIKDAKETYKREYIEREAQLKNIKQPTFSTLQDWSLFILFSGYSLFMLSVLIYILNFSSQKILMSCVFLLLACLLGISFVFVIQRFG
jgi:hypothetical protein